jgi:lysylphosphatidylglycerol synthetase-like protein (DUF2156 family)
MTDISKSFKQLDLIFISVLAAQILMALVFYILRDMDIADFSLLKFEFLPLVVLFINTSVILLAKYLFTARSKIDVKLQIANKISKYRNLSILIIALLDFANIINIVIFFLTGAQIYLLVALLVLILYIAYRPSKLKFADTSFSNEEKHKLFSEQLD